MPNYMIVDTFGYAFRPHIVDSDMLFHVYVMSRIVEMVPNAYMYLDEPIW